MGEMTDLLLKVADTLVAHPGLAAGLGAAVILLLFVWGVLSTSHRYR